MDVATNISSRQRDKISDGVGCGTKGEEADGFGGGGRRSSWLFSGRLKTERVVFAAGRRRRKSFGRRREASEPPRYRADTRDPPRLLAERVEGRSTVEVKK
jgi:hypothetical protein